jgi:predicted glycosyltransferase
MQIERAHQPRKTLLISSNGGGLGHLSRQVAIASAGTAAGILSPLILTMSKGSDAVRQMGLNVEYMPSRREKEMSFSNWHRFLSSTIVETAKRNNIEVIHFDGVSIYPGLVLASMKLPNVPFAWTRRGLWKEGSSTRDLAAAKIFDLIVEPSEVAGSIDHGPTSKRTDALKVPPITLRDAIPCLSRVEAARAIGLDPNRKTILVAIGSGAIGDNRSLSSIVHEAIEKNGDWQIVVATSPIANDHSYHAGNVYRFPSPYPITQFLNVFDAAVIAAGYNAPHEMISARIPSLVIPNLDTVVDDQMARAVGLAARQLTMMVAPDNASEVFTQVQTLLQDDTRARLKKNIDRLDPQEIQGGAMDVVKLLSRLNVRDSSRIYRRLWSGYTEILLSVAEKSAPVRRRFRRS